ncbi:unnamed protein product [Gulo gulo]|uniref:Uncharacterized protein n=1 Tax=Gulo gulo TaxID=48420 RepID=A0A9X9Q6A6_GULGU|nr:unnamed protein product [Gulo gulo]
MQHQVRYAQGKIY